MIYEDLLPISRKEAEGAFRSSDIETITVALLRLVLHDPDAAWLQNTVLNFIEHPEPMIRGCAATCLGHIARIHKTIDVERSILALTKLLEDPTCSGKAEDAIEDIQMFATES